MKPNLNIERYDLQELVRATVTDCTRMARLHYGDRQEPFVQFKDVNNPVTDSDKQIEDLIRNRFAPWDVSVVGEEYAPKKTDSPFTLYIDPIDGTKSYIRGRQGCAVSVALAENDVLIAAAVGDIATQHVYWARKNERIGGANYAGGIIDCIGVRREELFEYKRQPLKPQVALNETAYHLFTPLEAAGFSACVNGPSGALQMALVAAGNYDGMVFMPRKLNNPSAYDIAAGAFLLQAAGVCLTDADGKAYDYQNPKNGIIAARRDIYKELLEMVNDGRKSS